jgi:predicted CXXCH cytochrome family protein
MGERATGGLRRACRTWALVVGLAGLALPAGAAEQAPSAEACLTCHANPITTVLPSGERISFQVDPQDLARSAHGGKLTCTDCHRDIRRMPHVRRAFSTRREYTVALYEACKGCHFANYTKTLDSAHYALLSRGDPRAPVCVDCHGAHGVARPGSPRSRISQTCARCHRDVFTAYSGSVHGKALAEEGNPDVPTCTDCHRSHDVEDPRTASFKLRTPELCAGCHRDGGRMAKYGLSTAVFDTYVQDFHGMTARFYRSERADPTAFTAVCTDCHGVHDIRPAKDPASPVLRANLAATCRKCHAGATENFPAAWLSHYEASWRRAPLVYAVKVFYWIFIPFTIGGLLIHIGLHLWRVAVNR